MNDEHLRALAEIICDYRKNELDYPIGTFHIECWLSQFEEGTQDIILAETLHILKKWYFGLNRFYEFFDEVLKYLEKKYSLKGADLVRNIVFVSLQRKGNSQKSMLQQLNDMIVERHGFGISTSIDLKKMFYVYIDDGLYTGIHARSDLKVVIEQLPEGASLDVFYLIGGEQGIDYSEQRLKNVAKERGIDINIFRMEPLSNYKRATVLYHEGIEEESYSPIHTCLWPDGSVDSIPEIKEYIDSNIRQKNNSEKHLFRYGYWKDDCGVFSSVKNRGIVEKEFLKKGIEIAKRCHDNNGLYPLGFNSWPSLGFGSFCATFMNISNTCPLVLWWGNNIKDGNVLDYWYPLLPRRINKNEETNIFEEPFDDYMPVHRVSEPYNTCPDCGRLFGIDEDGGNGFCTNCAWKH